MPEGGKIYGLARKVLRKITFDHGPEKKGGSYGYLGKQ